MKERGPGRWELGGGGGGLSFQDDGIALLTGAPLACPGHPRSPASPTQDFPGNVMFVFTLGCPSRRQMNTSVLELEPCNCKVAPAIAVPRRGPEDTGSLSPGWALGPHQGGLRCARRGRGVGGANTYYQAASDNA